MFKTISSLDSIYKQDMVRSIDVIHCKSVNNRVTHSRYTSNPHHWNLLVILCMLAL